TGAGATTINAASNTRRQYGLRAAGQQKPHTDTPVEEETMSTTVSEMLPIQTNEGPSGYDAKENDAIGAAGWQEAEQPAQNPDTFVEDGASEEVQVVNGAFAANTGIGSIPEQAENARETDAANAGNGAEAVAINTEESAEAKSGRNSYETAVLNTAAAKDKVGKDEMEQMIWDATGEEIEVKLDDYGEDIAVIREFMDSLNQEQKESVNHRDRDSGFVESSESGSGSGSKSVSEPESMAVEAALTDEAAYMRIQARKESIIENGKDAVETDDATGEAPEDGSIHMPSGFGDSGLGNADADGRAAVGNGMSAYDPGSDETGGAGQTGGNIVNSEGSYAVFETPATEVKVDFVDKSAQWRQAGAADQIDKAEFLKAFEKEARIILSGGKSEMVMQLKPESLGKLTLKIVTEHGVVNAKFIVESEQVKRELETNIQMLKETLTSQGMSVRECTVHVGVQDRYADGPVGGGSEGAKKRRAQSLSGGDVSVSANGIDSSRREILRSHYFFDESSIQFLA
ncbi:MAG: flagellar hook-length control protein FliK, partial [Oscillospiraceae bacterium]|nr:flagellar hook-length control protein FliK [Oscillospiraceae bacterium]